MTNTRTSKTAAGKSDSNGAVKKAQSARSAASVKAKPAATAAAAAKPPVKARRSPALKTAAQPAAVVPARVETATAELLKAVKAPKLRKAKLVRNEFTMQEQEYQVLSDLKQAFKDNGVAVKRSELVRVAVSLLTSHDLPALQALVARLPARKSASAG